jgi:hypothetical protein
VAYYKLIQEIMNDPGPLESEIERLQRENMELRRELVLERRRA